MKPKTREENSDDEGMDVTHLKIEVNACRNNICLIKKISITVRKKCKKK